jgi:hypothetical protein
VRRVAVVMLVAVVVAAVIAVMLLPGAAAVLAATPVPSSVVGGDPRSAGEGPGLVGTPVVAIGIVFGLGLVAAAVTLAYVRLTGGPRRPG